MLKVSVKRLDGSLLEWDEPDDVIERLHKLQDDGLSGRALVDELFTDDLGLPPSVVTISGKLPNGKRVHHAISCD